MSSNLVMTESNHGFIKNNLSFNEVCIINIYNII